MHATPLLRACALISLAVLATAGSGCHRQHYREAADREVHSLVEEKSSDPRWALPGFTIEMDPRSRYFDSYDPDRPPMPPDDPASHEFMHCVDCKKGWPHWHRDGDRFELENPGWRQYLGDCAPLNEKGEVILNVDAALRLAYTHSPDYQSQLETLYLSALDVSTERFRLDAQFFGGSDTNYRHRGGLTPFVGTRRDDSNTLTVGRTSTQNPSLQLRRRFATAGELLVGFANSFVWEFSSGDANLTSSIANFSLIQPLLRGAGRDVALERLTLAERTLLGNLRAFERYRQGFYTRVAIGDASVSGPQRRGGLQGDTGLTGFTGTGAGGFGGVGEAAGFGSRGGVGGAGGGGTAGFGAAGGGAGTLDGFLGLLQRSQQVRNREDSLNLELRTLRLLEAYLESGVIDLVQVDQFRQSIETERALLLQNTNDLLLRRDSYVVGTLGLPPDLPVALDDQLIQQFQLVTPQATALQAQIATFQDELGDLPEEPDLSSLQGLLERVATLPQQFEECFSSIEQDIARMEERAPQREKAMTDAGRREFQKERTLQAQAFADLRNRVLTALPRLDAMRSALGLGTRRQTAAEFVVYLDDLYRLAGEVMLEQARPRLESVFVEQVELTPETAFQTALVNRLDIMNIRARLVDSWRLIAYNADALQSQLNVVLDGDLSTARDNPTSFRAPTGTVRAGVQFDAPFTRLLERNNYRQALIDYQRDRRQFIQSLDSVYGSMRQLVRRLEELRVNLEIQRRAVAIAIRRVDLTGEELNKPVPPPAPGQAAAQFGPTAAQNLLTALEALRDAQNNFMSVWLNYYATRMQLMRELGLMVLDEEGRWIDVPITSPDNPQIEEIVPPPAVPVEWMDVAFRKESPPAETQSAGNKEETSKTAVERPSKAVQAASEGRPVARQVSVTTQPGPKAPVTSGDAEGRASGKARQEGAQGEPQKPVSRKDAPTGEKPKCVGIQRLTPSGNQASKR